MYFHLICDHLKFKNTVGLLNKSYYSYVIFSICKSLKKTLILKFFGQWKRAMHGFLTRYEPGKLRPYSWFGLKLFLTGYEPVKLRPYSWFGLKLF